MRYKNQNTRGELEPFYYYCINGVKLNVIGLMAIPPNDNNAHKYFKSLNELNKSLTLKELSMGMSSDLWKQVQHGATFRSEALFSVQRS